MEEVGGFVTKAAFSVDRHTKTRSFSMPHFAKSLKNLNFAT